MKLTRKERRKTQQKVINEYQKHLKAAFDWKAAQVQWAAERNNKEVQND